jgi:hypothetical protein
MDVNLLSPLNLHGGVLIKYKKTLDLRLSLSVHSFAKVTHLHGIAPVISLLEVVLVVYIMTLYQLYKLSK